MSLIAKNFSLGMIIFLTASCFVSKSDAAAVIMPVKVVKSKQGRSLIIYNKDASLKPGIYQLGEMQSRTAMELEGIASKDKFISLSFDANLLKQKTTVSGGSSTEMDVRNLTSNLTFGWNRIHWEWGGFAAYSFNTTGPVDVKTLVVGLLVDKNFNPNDLETDYVFGIRLQAGVGQEDSSSNSKAANVTLVQPGLYLKWFGLNPNIGVTAEVAYQMKESSIDETKTQTQGALFRLGIANYF